jgi:hypothetical protein
MIMTRKRKEELDKMHWKDRYEYEARREGESLHSRSEKELIERIRCGVPPKSVPIFRNLVRDRAEWLYLIKPLCEE